jgi:multiple sugar transport system substrate-binding protein
MFEAGKIGMLMGGSYMLVEYQANDAINNKIDVVEFPEVDGVEPNVINGLGYCVFEGSKHKDAAADFAVWLGGAEAMKIQGEEGAVISARNDAQGYFAEANKDLNLAAFTNHSDEANPLPVCKSSAELYDLEANELKWAYSGEKTLPDAGKELKEKADAVLDKMNK